MRRAGGQQQARRVGGKHLPRGNVYLLPSGQKHGRLSKGGSHSDGADGWLDVAHGIVDGKGLRLVAELIPSFLKFPDRECPAETK